MHVFNFPFERGGIYCKRHRSEGMVDVISRKCLHSGCTTFPTYNSPGKKGGVYCSKHALDGMINVKHKKCLHTSRLKGRRRGETVNSQFNNLTAVLVF